MLPILPEAGQVTPDPEAPRTLLTRPIDGDEEPPLTSQGALSPGLDDGTATRPGFSMLNTERVRRGRSGCHTRTRVGIRQANGQEGTEAVPLKRDGG